MATVKPVAPASAMLAIGSEHRLRSENLPFDIDVWYPLVADLTFLTMFLPLTREEALAVVHYHQKRFLGRSPAVLTVNDVQVLCDLESKVDQALRALTRAQSQQSVATQCGAGDAGAFFRLCGRSPKDGEPLTADGRVDDVYRRFEAELDRLREAGEPDTPNTQLQAIARTQWLRVVSGKQVLNLMLTSERVFADLHDWLEYGEPEQIVLRAWQPGLTLENEFRVFVCNNRVTAISQYDHYTVYPRLAALREHLQALLLRAWEAVHARLNEPSYVADFGYLPDTDRVILIELSPFRPCTGAALFNWVTDRHVLENGPLEFRLQTRLHPQIDQLLDSNWHQRWREAARLPYWHWFPERLAETGPVRARATRRYALVVGGLSAGLGAAAAAAVATRTRVATTPLATTMAAAVAIGAATAAVVTTGHWFLERVRCRKAAAGTVSRASPSLASPPAGEHALLFVYGTLKRGFHWHQKFLSRAVFVAEARTDDVYPLVVGDSGVPYLLGDQPGRGLRICGELFRVGAADLLGLDQYEGCGKGYYVRRPVAVHGADGRAYTAHAYFKLHSTPDLLARPFQTEYSLEQHRQLYRPIRHIAVKQDLYLQEQGAAAQS